MSDSRLRRQAQDGQDVVWDGDVRREEEVRRRKLGQLRDEHEKGLFVVPVKGVGADEARASLVRMSEMARRGGGGDLVREGEGEGEGGGEKGVMTDDGVDMEMDRSSFKAWASSSAAATRSAGLCLGSGEGSGLFQGPGGSEGGEGPGPGPESRWTRGRDEGLQVYTVGQLMPRGEYGGGMGRGGEGEGGWGFGAPARPPRADGYSFGGESSLASSEAYAPQAGTMVSGGGPDSPNPSQRASSSKTIRVRRSTFVPGWAVPPRVLLVDDDEVSRKLWGKFLQVYGCTIDVAVDGVGAVNKMNLEKYDLVLMVCFTPGFSFDLFVKLFRCRIL